MKKINRHFEIDYLRAVAIFTVILIHSAAYFLRERNVFFVWDFSQFAVVLFVFCSSYLLCKRPVLIKFSDFVSYAKKRLVRLILPYYVFLIVYFPLALFAEGKKLTPSFVFQSWLAVGGVDLSWLVLLFIIFSLTMPLVFFLYHKQRPLFYLYSFISLISSLLFLFYKPAFNYKLIMWLPWSLVGIVALFFVKYEKNKKFLLFGAVLSFIIYYALKIILSQLGKSLTMFDNKYPPNLFHLAYGLIFLFLFWRSFTLRLYSYPYLKKILFFLSQNSYSLFFVHYLIIYFLLVYLQIKFTFPFFFFIVLFSSLIVQIALNKILTFFRR